LAVGNIIDVENMDLLTPNRLILGRNNDRSPSGNCVVSVDPSKMMKENYKVYDAWFESWLLNHEVGDIVLFTKVDSILSKTYTYGMVTNVEVGRDGNIRRVTLKYQNQNEKVPRETTRSVRNLVLIHSIDDSDIMYEIGEMAKRVDVDLKLNC